MDNKVNTIDTIRYMGIKTKLLEFIIPEIKRVTPENGTVCDLMAGSNTVAYALKPFFTVFTNDVQEYSYTISKAIIKNQKTNISKNTAFSDLNKNILYNADHKEFDYFETTYANTYFSKKQCADIDSVRYAISKIEDENKYNLYLFALMNAMCKIQSTPGHFAQYMPATHNRIIPLQSMNLIEEFYEKCNLYSDLVFSNHENKCFCTDYNNLIASNTLANVDTIYLDSPYSQEQYSRFYHILETVVKYDRPVVNFKAKYRDDRFMSNFCYKNKVADEFRKICFYCNQNNINLVISYSNKGVLPQNQLQSICEEFFSNVEISEITYKHSTQGKGSNSLLELIITCH